MHGLMDPFNRGTFFENDKETYQDVLKLTNMRNQEKVLQTGHALYMAADDDVLAILRFISSKKMFLERHVRIKHCCFLSINTNGKRD